MIEAISLTGVDISGFRRLGDPVSLRFHEGPGVTLLVGPNGSGKSTVLDAIEWALTGGASRLPMIRGMDARRAPSIFKTLGSKNEPEVVLYFSQSGGTQEHVVGPGQPNDQTTHFLRRSDAPWQDFDGTAAALRWTHFSSQRSVAKLGYDNGEAVLKAFAGPAGLDRHKGLHGILWGHETQAAFKTRVTDAEERVTEHRLALERVDAALAAGTAAGDESGPSRRLTDLVRQIQRDIDPNLDVASGDLSKLETALTASRRDTEEALSRFRGKAAERREANLRMRRIEVEVEASRQTLKTSEQLRDRRTEDAARAHEELETARTRVSKIHSEVVRAREDLGKRERLKQLNAEIRDLTEDSRHALTQLAAAQARGIALERTRTVATRVRAGRALVDLRESRAQYKSFGDPDEIRDKADLDQIALTAQRDALLTERAIAEAAITSEQDRLESLATLTAALKDQIKEHDESCPVCAAPYPTGELLRRAQSITFSSSPAADVISQRLKYLSHELGRISGQLQFTRGRRDEAASLAAQFSRWEIEEKRQSELFGEPWNAEAQERLETELLELREDLGMADDLELSALSEAALDIADRAHNTAEMLNAQLIVLQTTYNDVRFALQNVPDETALHARLAALEPQLGRASATQAEATDDYTLAVELAAVDSRASQRALEVLVGMDNDLALERRRFEKLDHDYRAAIGVNDEASHVLAMDGQISLISSFLEQLRSIRSEVDLLRQAAQGDRNLDLIWVRYSFEERNSSLEPLRSRVAKSLAADENRLVRIKALGQRLKERARYRRQVELKLQGDTLHPWNNLFRAVYTSLAGALGETLEWTTSNRANDLRFSNFDARPTPHVLGRPIHGWAAGHFFSEGQLAALQIASMITASILLPWSRWPALLLDDPLQHADVIKVGAFADLMRSLAQDRGHQIFLTTHDAVQAEFIAAKFRSTGLPANIVRFDRQGMIHQSVG